MNTKTMISKIEKMVIIPAKRRCVSITRDEAIFIYNFLRERKITETLEIGFAYGYSAIYIMSATGAPHIVIDPYQGEFDNLGISNVKKLHLYKRLIFYPDYSQIILPKLVLSGKKFAFVFIDGGHRFDDIFIDFYYSDLLLRMGGFIIFHDLVFKSTQLVAAWIKYNRHDYKFIHTSRGNLIIVQKCSVDNRAGNHFADFCLSPDLKNKFHNLVSKIGALLKISPKSIFLS